MPRHGNFRAIAVVVAGVALAGAAAVTVPAGAAPNGVAADWERDLRAEAAIEYDCEVTFFSHVVVRDLPGRQLVMAKAHCEDGRSFDALRHSRDEPFEFQECTRKAADVC